MNWNSALWLAVCAEFACMALGWLVQRSETRKLPGPLQNLRDTHATEAFRKPLNRVLLGLGVVLLVAHLVSSIVLLCHVSWGRPLYVVANVLGPVMSATQRQQPEVDTQWAPMIGEFGNVLTGLVIGIAFFSPLNTQFHCSMMNNRFSEHRPAW